MTIRVRAEEAADEAAVRAVNLAAFAGSEEADLVERLRAAGAAALSLVAVDGVEVVGHILFSPVSIADGAGPAGMMGLAPMAVLPGRQRQGIGGALVREGLRRLAEQGVSAVVALGHPAYYPRFGFRSADRFGLGCEYPAPPETFLALELAAGALREARGTVRYHAAFAAG